MGPELEHDDPLGDVFRRRLRAQLDRVQPRASRPRYLTSSGRSVSPWRLAPAALAAGIAGMLVLTAYAATGSPNPVVWTQRIVGGIESGPAPQSNPPASPAPSAHSGAAPVPTHHDDGTPKPEPSESSEPRESPEPGNSPEPTESPEPSGGDHSGSSGSGESSPSPSPGDH